MILISKEEFQEIMTTHKHHIEIQENIKDKDKELMMKIEYLFQHFKL